MRKLIASDLDGTLLRPGTWLSEATIQGIASLKEKGHAIAIASGRTFDEIIDICKPLSLSTYEHAYWIGYNGVEVKKASTGELIHSVRYDWNVVRLVWRHVKQMGMHMHVFTDHAVYLTEGIQQTLRIVQEGLLVQTVDPDRFDTDDPVRKIVVLDSIERCDTLRASLPKTILNATRAFKSADMLVEFVPPLGTKGDALEALAKHLSIDRDRVYAFGDEENDLTMIEYAGFGIAMENAKPVVLNAAKEITSSNKEDGVVQALKKHGLID